MQTVSIGFKSTGYFFRATRKSPDMILLDYTFGRTQILACAGPRKWPYPTTCWPKSSKRDNFVLFRFVRSNHLKKPVFWIYRSGGRPSRVVVQKSQNRNCSRFWQHRQNGPYWAGGQKRPKILRWYAFKYLCTSLIKLADLAVIVIKNIGGVWRVEQIIWKIGNILVLHVFIISFLIDASTCFETN